MQLRFILLTIQCQQLVTADAIVACQLFYNNDGLTELLITWLPIEDINNDNKT